MTSLQVQNQSLIAAPVATIWAILTDIELLPRLNNSIIKVTGTIDKLNATRICEIRSNGRTGESTETITEFIVNKCICWIVDHDTMGRSRKLSGLQYCIWLDEIDNELTNVSFETFYEPVSLLMAILNILVIKRKISSAQNDMILNLKSLAIRHKLKVG